MWIKFKTTWLLSKMTKWQNRIYFKQLRSCKKLVTVRTQKKNLFYFFRSLIVSGCTPWTIYQNTNYQVRCFLSTKSNNLGLCTNHQLPHMPLMNTVNWRTVLMQTWNSELGNSRWKDRGLLKLNAILIQNEHLKLPTTIKDIK